MDVFLRVGVVGFVARAGKIIDNQSRGRKQAEVGEGRRSAEKFRAEQGRVEQII